MMTSFVIKIVSEVYGLFRRVSFSEEMNKGFRLVGFKLLHSTGKKADDDLNISVRNISINVHLLALVFLIDTLIFMSPT